MAGCTSYDSSWAVTELSRSPLFSLLYAFPLPQLKLAADSTPSTAARARAEDNDGEARGDGGDSAQHGGVAVARRQQQNTTPLPSRVLFDGALAPSSLRRRQREAWQLGEAAAAPVTIFLSLQISLFPVPPPLRICFLLPLFSPSPFFPFFLFFLCFIYFFDFPEVAE